MAELNTGGRLQPRVDLTAMVDLAFLLITFFMLTTSLSKPHAMDVAMPDEGDPGVDVGFADNRTVTVLLGPRNTLTWYWGLLDNPIEGPSVTTEDKAGIRRVLLDMKNKVIQKTGDKKKGLMVVIRPGEHSTYRNLVNILDEMKITGVQQYMIGDMSDTERELLTGRR